MKNEAVNDPLKKSCFEKRVRHQTFYDIPVCDYHPLPDYRRSIVAMQRIAQLDIVEIEILPSNESVGMQQMRECFPHEHSSIP